MDFCTFKPSDRYRKFILFKSSTGKELIPQKIFWLAVVVIFSVVHLPKDRLYNFIAKVLESLPTSLFEALFNKNDPQHLAAHYMAGGIVNKLVIPLKEFLFLIAFLVIISPLIRAIWRERHFWKKFKIKEITISALGVFLILSLLVFPGGLNSSKFGLLGMGPAYGRMSLNPFAENTGWYYRRLLKPAIAHFINLDGSIRYYLFSLLGTYILIFLILAFVESKISKEQTEYEKKDKNLSPRIRFLFYVSVATSSYLITDFLWPGYADQLSFILILLMGCIPMTSQERLVIVALCMVNHEASAFSLVPIIFFCFPKQERIQAFLLMSLYFGIWFASYGLRVDNALAMNTVKTDDTTSLQLFIDNFGYALVGVFFSYKLFWIIFLYVAWMLWEQNDRSTLVGIIGITLFPALILPVAWDTTRLMGLGCFGMLITLVILIDEQRKISRLYRHLLFTSIYVNIIIPSYSIVLERQESFGNYPYPGLYRLIVLGFKHL